MRDIENDEKMTIKGNAHYQVNRVGEGVVITLEGMVSLTIFADIGRDTQIKAQNGHIVVKGNVGERVVIDSINGHIVVKGNVGERVVIDSINGDIAVKGNIADGASVTSRNGSIKTEGTVASSATVQSTWGNVEKTHKPWPRQENLSQNTQIRRTTTFSNEGPSTSSLSQSSSTDSERIKMSIKVGTSTAGRNTIITTGAPLQNGFSLSLDMEVGRMTSGGATVIANELLPPSGESSVGAQEPPRPGSNVRMKIGALVTPSLFVVDSGGKGSHFAVGSQQTTVRGRECGPCGYQRSSPQEADKPTSTVVVAIGHLEAERIELVTPPSPHQQPTQQREGRVVVEEVEDPVQPGP